MDETKEIAEKGGVTFQELFIVFKRLWLVMLAIVIICGASITLLAKKRTRPIYYARLTLLIDASSSENANRIANYFIGLVHEDVLRLDMDKSTRYVRRQYNDNTKLSDEEKAYYISDLRYSDSPYARFDGGIAVSYNEGSNYLYITYGTFSGPQYAVETVKQVVNSLINLSKLPKKDGSDYMMPAFAGKIDRIDDNDPYPWQQEASTNKWSLVGIALGLVIDVALLLLVYKLDDTVKTKEELERLTGVQFITYIEDIEEEGGSKY